MRRNPRAGRPGIEHALLQFLMARSGSRSADGRRSGPQQSIVQRCHTRLSRVAKPRLAKIDELRLSKRRRPARVHLLGKLEPQMLLRYPQGLGPIDELVQVDDRTPILDTADLHLRDAHPRANRLLR